MRAFRFQSSEVADQPAEDYDRVNAINLRGVWACMKHELRRCEARQRSDRQLLVDRRPQGPGADLLPIMAPSMA